MKTLAIALSEALEDLNDWFHHWLIKQLVTKGGVFSPKDINRATRKVNMGFYSFKKEFVEPHESIMLWLLHKVYGYTFTETKIKFHATGFDFQKEVLGADKEM